MIRLWLDDVRPAPEGWVHARTNAAAEVHLSEPGKVGIVSLDHDLGGDPAGGLNVRGDSPDGNGYDLVCWMIANNRIPNVCIVHTWNPAGAVRMCRALREAGAYVLRQPYCAEYLALAKTLHVEAG